MKLQVGLGMKLYFVLFASIVLSGSQAFGSSYDVAISGESTSVDTGGNRKFSTPRARFSWSLGSQGAAPLKVSYRYNKKVLDSVYESAGDGQEIADGQSGGSGHGQALPQEDGYCDCGKKHEAEERVIGSQIGAVFCQMIDAYTPKEPQRTEFEARVREGLENRCFKGDFLYAKDKNYISLEGDCLAIGNSKFFLKIRKNGEFERGCVGPRGDVSNVELEKGARDLLKLVNLSSIDTENFVNEVCRIVGNNRWDVDFFPFVDDGGNYISFDGRYLSVCSSRPSRLRLKMRRDGLGVWIIDGFKMWRYGKQIVGEAGDSGKGKSLGDNGEGDVPLGGQGLWSRLGRHFLGFGTAVGVGAFLGVGAVDGVGALEKMALSRASGDSPVDGGNSSAGTSSRVGLDVNAAAPVLVEAQNGVAGKVSDSGLDETLRQAQEALVEVGADLYSSKNSEAVEKVLVQEGSSVARFVSDENLSMVKKTALGSVLAAGVLKLFHYCYSQYKKNSGLHGAKGKAQMWAKKALYYAQQYKKMTMATAGGLAVVGVYLLQNR